MGWQDSSLIANEKHRNELKKKQMEKRNQMIEAAAAAIATADVLLVTTGAGWSADSGLAVYKDVADVPAVDASPVRRLARALGTERDEKARFSPRTPFRDRKFSGTFEAGNIRPC